MNGFWVILSFIAGFFLLFAFVPIHIHVRYSRNREDDRIYVRFRVLLFSYTVEIPTAKAIAKARSSKLLKIKWAKGFQKQQKKSKASFILTLEKLEKIKNIWQSFLENVYSYEKWLRNLLKIFKVEEFRWQTEMGVGDAAATGTLSGLIWGIKGSVIGLMTHFFTMKTYPSIDVRPHFQEAVMITTVSFSITFIPVQMMLAGMKLVYYWLKERRIWHSRSQS